MFSAAKTWAKAQSKAPEPEEEPDAEEEEQDPSAEPADGEEPDDGEEQPEGDEEGGDEEADGGAPPPAAVGGEVSNEDLPLQARAASELANMHDSTPDDHRAAAHAHGKARDAHADPFEKATHDQAAKDHLVAAHAQSQNPGERVIGAHHDWDMRHGMAAATLKNPEGKVRVVTIPHAELEQGVGTGQRPPRG